MIEFCGLVGLSGMDARPFAALDAMAGALGATALRAGPGARFAASARDALDGDGNALRLGPAGAAVEASWDASTRALRLARARAGVRRLYWAEADACVLFATRPEALMASGLFEPRLDENAARAFLGLGFVPAPATLFAGVSKLRAGASIEFSPAGRAERAPPPLPPPDEALSLVDARAEFERLLVESVRAAGAPDAPVLLSGGLDSALVATAFGEAFDVPPRMATLVLREAGYSNVERARAVARELGGTLVEIEMPPPDPARVAGLLASCADPVADASLLPTHALLAGLGAPVALSGDGGDELFGGYDAYVADRLASRVTLVPGARALAGLAASLFGPRPEKRGLANTLRRFSEGLAFDAALGHYRWVVLDAERGADAARETLARARGEVASPLAAASRADLAFTLPDGFLPKMELAGQAVGVEVRPPLLDEGIVNLGARLPDRLRIRGRERKRVLRAAFGGKLPRAATEGPKEGFGAPIKTWLRGPLRPLLDEAIALARRGLADEAGTKRLIDAHLSNRADHGRRLWARIVLELWSKRWLGER